MIIITQIESKLLNLQWFFFTILTQGVRGITKKNSSI